MAFCVNFCSTAVIWDSKFRVLKFCGIIPWTVDLLWFFMCETGFCFWYMFRVFCCFYEISLTFTCSHPVANLLRFWSSCVCVCIKTCSYTALMIIWMLLHLPLINKSLYFTPFFFITLEQVFSCRVETVITPCIIMGHFFILCIVDCKEYLQLPKIFCLVLALFIHFSGEASERDCLESNGPSHKQDSSYYRDH